MFEQALQPLSILLIDDAHRQLRQLELELQDGGLEVHRAWDYASVKDALNQSSPNARKIDAVALDLGLPPEQDNPFRTGIPLARELRVQHNLPVLAYTSLTPKSADFSRLLAELLPLRVSFVSLRSLPDDFSIAQLLHLVWRGFFFLSPTSADFLRYAVATRPDPLDQEEWHILSMVNDGLTNKDIAAKMSYSAETVKSKLQRIGEKLSADDYLHLMTNDRNHMARWYNEHHIRYRRHPVSLNSR